jgi:hypothetical protein
MKQAYIDDGLRFVLLTSMLTSLYLAVQQYTLAGLFWDLKPILSAIYEQKNGLDPYRHMAESMFIYHPYALKALTLIDRLYPLRDVIITVYLLIFVWFAWQTFYFLKHRHSATSITLVQLSALCFGGLSLWVFLCGNFSAYFHCVLFGLVLQYFRTKKLYLIYIFSFALLGFALVKPYFLSYVLIYFLAFKFWRAASLSMTLVAGALASWFSGKLLFPLEYARFLSALQYQIIIKDDLGAFSTMRFMAPLFGYAAGFLLHLAAVGSLLLYCFFNNRVKRYFNDSESQLMLLFFFIVTLNPRLAFYDFFVCLIAVFFLVLIKLPNTYQRVLLCGVPFALYAQLAAHPSRWIFLSFFAVLLCFLLMAYQAQRQGLLKPNIKIQS